MTGVTVRTLHHYDRLGLLKPSGRTAAGYRVYGERDVGRLEQIVVLKFLGLPLREIRKLLEGSDAEAGGVLRAQWKALIAKRQQIDAALQAINAAENALQSGEQPDLKTIIEVIQMQQDTDWMKHYYNEEAQRTVEERKTLWSPELQEQVTRDWTELGGDIEAVMARGEEPQGAAAQQLAERWRGLLKAFTGGDPNVQAGLNAMYADRKNWKADYKMPYSDAAGEFMKRALQVSGGC